MRTTDTFKQTIKNYLDDLASKDSDFKLKYESKNKNLDDCIKYILNTVQKSGINGFTDDEVYGMALHYYDEENVDVGGSINMKVVVNHTVELTEEEKQKAKKDAIDKIHQETREKMTVKRTKKNQPEEKETTQPTLF